MKIFAICYYAPPKLTPQAIQIGRQLYHLDAEVVLLHGSDPQFADGYDQYPDFFERVAPLCVPAPAPAWQALAQRAARRLLPLYGTCPDGLGPWRRRARRPALACIAAARPDAIVSFGMPMSDHLLGLNLKRATGLPWLAHFSDPWCDNVFHPGPWLERKVNAALERRVIGAADQVLFTSQRTLALVMDKHPPPWRAKAAVLPHAWDMAHIGEPGSEPDRGQPKVIRHIGACYGARSPEPLFAALARMLARGDRFDGVRFEFIGHVSPMFLASAAFKALPPGLVRMRGQVAYRESLRLAREAAALLLIDAPSARDSVFLPSKLVEYIGACRPVWGITPPGTSAELIAEWSGTADTCAAPDDIDAVMRMLGAGLARLAAAPNASPHAALHGALHAGPESVRQRFAPARVAGALRQHVVQAIARARA